VLSASNIRYELAERARGISCGGVGLVHQMAVQLGLGAAIDERLTLLKQHLPYHESDHVLHIAYNALCGGTCLEDLELRRNDEAFLDALGVERLPDPTTAGDFCRRFAPESIDQLFAAVDEVRRKVWARQPASFFDRATIDMDGTMVPTTGECKEGIGRSYKKVWGYHPLVISLAETGEVLRVLNRSGNRPSHEGAAEQVDGLLTLCRQAGFRRVLLRGDTDFSQTAHLDRWSADEQVRFIFGFDVHPSLHLKADELPPTAWKPLQRPHRPPPKTKPRRRPENVKERLVREAGYKNIRLEGEQVAEFDHKPALCKRSYRLVIVRKDLLIEQRRRGERPLYDDYRYFFYLTNDKDLSAQEVVFAANDRCDQENLHAQLKGGVRALTAPVDGLVSNGAYMAMASLAWTLKAWLALHLPEPPGRWAEKRRAEKRAVLRMEFKTFAGAFVRLPCQIVRTGRRIVYRLLGWNNYSPIFFRLTAALRC
jgi:hypothetical protein